MNQQAVEAAAHGEPAVDGYQVRQAHFQGSLSELASLLRRGRLAPAQVDLVALVHDFLGYFEQHAERDLDLASEALPALAQVIEVKLRLLLPRPPRAHDEDLADEAVVEAVEAVETLARLEHAIAFLRERRERRRHLVAAKPPRLRFPRRVPPVRLALGQLAALAARYRSDAYFELQRDRLSVPDAMRRILERLATLGRAELRSLATPADWGVRTVFFAGLLELLREKRVKAEQTAPYGPIVVEPSEQPR